MRFIAQPQALHVVGIALRTHNGEAFQTIPPLWGRFAQSGLAERLPHRLSDDVYAVYTQFQNAGVDNSGWYTPGHRPRCARRHVRAAARRPDPCRGPGLVARGV